MNNEENIASKYDIGELNKNLRTAWMFILGGLLLSLYGYSNSNGLVFAGIPILIMGIIIYKYTSSGIKLVKKSNPEGLGKNHANLTKIRRY